MDFGELFIDIGEAILQDPDRVVSGLRRARGSRRGKIELLRTITDIIGDAENYCFSNPGFSNSDKSIKD